MSGNISSNSKKPHLFKKGQSGNLKGKPKGTLNRTTALLKDAILMAAQQAGGGDKDGMVNYLAKQATETPGPFLALLGKVLPMQITGADGPDGLPTEIKISLVSSQHKLS
jgi:hypothetical protein